MATNDQIIRDFAAAWSRLDAEELASYFTSDAFYHNIPMDPVAGQANIRAFLADFLREPSSINFEIRHQLAAGNLVFNERVDHSVWGGKKVSLPVLGVFELEGDKIKSWRDYFDMATFTKALEE